jgi:hypothetical protein
MPPLLLRRWCFAYAKDQERMEVPMPELIKKWGQTIQAAQRTEACCENLDGFLEKTGMSSSEKRSKTMFIQGGHLWMGTFGRSAAVSLCPFCGTRW